MGLPLAVPPGNLNLPTVTGEPDAGELLEPLAALPPPVAVDVAVELEPELELEHATARSATSGSIAAAPTCAILFTRHPFHVPLGIK
jgi:hypothetical protein